MSFRDLRKLKISKTQFGVGDDLLEEQCVVCQYAFDRVRFKEICVVFDISCYIVRRLDDAQYQIVLRPGGVGRYRSHSQRCRSRRLIERMEDKASLSNG